jgi:hypothetical protein
MNAEIASLEGMVARRLGELQALQQANEVGIRAAFVRPDAQSRSRGDLQPRHDPPAPAKNARPS